MENKVTQSSNFNFNQSHKSKSLKCCTPRNRIKRSGSLPKSFELQHEQKNLDNSKKLLKLDSSELQKGAYEHFVNRSMLRFNLDLSDKSTMQQELSYFKSQLLKHPERIELSKNCINRWTFETSNLKKYVIQDTFQNDEEGRMKLIVITVMPAKSQRK